MALKISNIWSKLGDLLGNKFIEIGMGGGGGGEVEGVNRDQTAIVTIYIRDILNNKMIIT